MSLNLHLDFRNYTKTPLDASSLETIVRDFLLYCGIEGDIALEMLIVGKQRIQTLNRQYRNINSPTDVLSFPLSSLPTTHYPLPTYPLGSIVICPNLVYHHWENSKYGAIPQEYAMIYVMIHGLMHLLGYNHDTDKQHDRWEETVEKFWPRLPWDLATAHH